MKLLGTIVNIMALLTVLMLGAFSVHAEEHVHASHVVEAWDTAPSDHAIDSHADHGGGAAMHCGAPILGPEEPILVCSIHVAAVRYFSHPSAPMLTVALDDLRPPRS